jgi:hypothetical protein
VAFEDREYEEFYNEAMSKDMARRHVRNQNAHAETAIELQTEWKAQVATLEVRRASYDAFGVLCSTLPGNIGVFKSSSLELLQLSPYVPVDHRCLLGLTQTVEPQEQRQISKWDDNRATAAEEEVLR